MLADFDIPMLSKDMNIALQKNSLGGKIRYRSLDRIKKRRLETLENPPKMSDKFLKKISVKNIPKTTNIAN